MSEFTGTPTFAGSADLRAEIALEGSWSALSSFVVSGLFIQRHTGTDSTYRIAKYVGEQNVPQDIKRMRRSVYEVARRMGQPVLVKHMFNDRDRLDGLADATADFQPAYGQVRNREPHSHGIGFFSKQLSPTEWFAPDGEIVTADVRPAPTYIQAPFYRGFGPGYLTFLIEPDVALDFFKLSPTGALIKVQSQTVVAPWFPDVNDNDLLVNVELDNQGNIIGSNDRFQAKMTNPVSIRGLDRRGRQEYSGDSGNRHIVNQTFEMALLPHNHALQDVEIDR